LSRREKAMPDHQPGDQPIEGEEAIIRLLAPLTCGAAGAFDLRDDCAVLEPEPGHELVLKTDPIAAGVHFPASAAPADIGFKALAVNVSDLAAKGAMPRAYLMALSFPEAPRRHWLIQFRAGLHEAQARFGCHLLGGDTDRRPGPVTISITVVGSVPRGRMVRRGTARVGDGLFVSGTLGDAALGLQLVGDPTRAAALGLSAEMAQHLVARYHRPQPRLALASVLIEHATAAMDLSDGVAKDLGRMCAASGCAAKVRLADLPLSPAAAQAVTADPRLWAPVVAGGDDYEILASIPPDRQARFEAAAHAAGVPVRRIGTLTEGSGVVLEGLDGRPLDLARSGWDHFAADPAPRRA